MVESSKLKYILQTIELLTTNGKAELYIDYNGIKTAVMLAYVTYETQLYRMGIVYIILYLYFYYCMPQKYKLDHDVQA